MFRSGIRRFSSTAFRGTESLVAQAEAKNQYGIRVSKAQGVVKGLTGGISAIKYVNLSRYEI